VGEEILLKERQVLLLDLGQLGVEVAGLGPHNGAVGFSKIRRVRFLSRMAV